MGPEEMHRYWMNLALPLTIVQAFSTGGACSEENFRTACWKCNTRKNDAPLEAWEQRDKRLAIKGKYGEPEQWDGLTALFVVLAEWNPALLTTTERDWLRALKASHLRQANR